MAATKGKAGKVMYGSVVVANMVEWSISGMTVATEDVTPFNATIKSFVAAEAGDPGTISFNGFYDPTDTTGQIAIAALCSPGLGVNNLYLYANVSTFWRVAAGGEIIVTKANAITQPRSRTGTISFEGKVSGFAMEQVGTGT